MGRDVNQRLSDVANPSGLRRPCEGRDHPCSGAGLPPAAVNGEPVGVIARIAVHFTLAQQRASCAAKPGGKTVAVPGPQDSVFFFFAGHGWARQGRFYLIPCDLGYASPRTRLASDRNAQEQILQRAISDLQLGAAMESIDAANLVLVADACNSGQLLESEEARPGPFNSKSLAQLAWDKGAYILTAAQSYQAAMESSQFGHGYLTQALMVEGLKARKADRETVRWRNRTQGVVRLRRDAGAPVTP